jgi:hypothetical protein
MATNKCGHPPCNCHVGGGERFCSDACRDLAASPSQNQTRCGCDHKDCAAQQHA